MDCHLLKKGKLSLNLFHNIISSRHQSEMKAVMFLSWNSTFFQKVGANIESILPSSSPQYGSSNIFCVCFPECMLKTQRSCKQQYLWLSLDGYSARWAWAWFPLTSQNCWASATFSAVPCLCSGWQWEQLGTQLKYSFMFPDHLLKFSVISTLIEVGTHYFPKLSFSIPMILRLSLWLNSSCKAAATKTTCIQLLPSVNPDSCEKTGAAFLRWGRGKRSWTCSGPNPALLEGKGGSMWARLSSCEAYELMWSL